VEKGELIQFPLGLFRANFSELKKKGEPLFPWENEEKIAQQNYNKNGGSKER